jgi:hypothetical protein
MLMLVLSATPSTSAQILVYCRLLPSAAHCSRCIGNAYPRRGIDCSFFMSPWVPVPAALVAAFPIAEPTPIQLQLGLLRTLRRQ